MLLSFLVSLGCLQSYFLNINGLKPLMGMYFGLQNNQHCNTIVQTIKPHSPLLGEQFTNVQLSRRHFYNGIAKSLSICSLVTIEPHVSYATELETVMPSAPMFSLPSTVGKNILSLTDLLTDDKWTVLYFYPGAYECACTLEARTFERDILKYKNLNTQIVGISVNPIDVVFGFCENNKLTYPLLSDISGKVAKSYNDITYSGYNTSTERRTYIITPDGKIAWVFSDVEFDVTCHSRNVMNKIKELQHQLT